MQKVQLAAALVAVLGFAIQGQAGAADKSSELSVTEKSSPSEISKKVNLADEAAGDKKDEKKPKEKKAKKEKGKEGSCKGKEGSCKAKDEAKGKEGSCKAKDDAKGKEGSCKGKEGACKTTEK